MRHYDETELIELYYLPTADGDVPEHLAVCGACRTRYASLAATLREHAAGPERRTDAKPEFFWERQAVRVRQRIDRGATSPHFAQLISIAATILLLVGGSFLVFRHNAGIVPVTATVSTNSTPTVETTTADGVVLQLETTQDVWSSDQLEPYRAAVEWESWLTNEQSTTGGES